MADIRAPVPDPGQVRARRFAPVAAAVAAALAFSASHAAAAGGSGAANIDRETARLWRVANQFVKAAKSDNARAEARLFAPGATFRRGDGAPVPLSLAAIRHEAKACRAVTGFDEGGADDPRSTTGNGVSLIWICPKGDPSHGTSTKLSFQGDRIVGARTAPGGFVRTAVPGGQ